MIAFLLLILTFFSLNIGFWAVVRLKWRLSPRFAEWQQSATSKWESKMQWFFIGLLMTVLLGLIGYWGFSGGLSDSLLVYVLSISIGVAFILFEGWDMFAVHQLHLPRELASTAARWSAAEAGLAFAFLLCALLFLASVFFLILNPLEEFVQEQRLSSWEEAFTRVRVEYGIDLPAASSSLVTTSNTTYAASTFYDFLGGNLGIVFIGGLFLVTVVVLPATNRAIARGRSKLRETFIGAVISILLLALIKATELLVEGTLPFPGTIAAVLLLGAFAALFSRYLHTLIGRVSWTCPVCNYADNRWQERRCYECGALRSPV